MISLSCLALFGLARHSTKYEWFPQPVYFITAFYILAVWFVPAFFALAGRNWARWVLAVSLAWNLLAAVLKHKPFSVVGVGAIPLILVAYYLFRPLANDFFRGQIPKHEQLRQVRETPLS